MTTVSTAPGPTDCLTDIAGLRVGHAVDEDARTGVTVILADTPVTMGVDVRGGGPGTRETDALKPTCLVPGGHAIVLAGGSVFGLAAADGVAAWLSAKGVGLPLEPLPVPVVPAAILYDLANGGNKDWGLTPPYRALGIAAAQAASVITKSGPLGAGYGARAGSRAGGIGTASLFLKDGTGVSALIAVNCFGEVRTGDTSFGDEIALPKAPFQGTNTTIGVVATNARLDKAGCERLAIMAQDGLARRIRPIHSPFDGDTLFTIASATGAPGAPEPQAHELAMMLTLLGTMAADCVAKAIDRAVSENS